MIELTERCERYKIISSKIQNNMMISYLTAFARSRYVREFVREEKNIYYIY